MKKLLLTVAFLLGFSTISNAEDGNFLYQCDDGTILSIQVDVIDELTPEQIDALIEMLERVCNNS